MEFTRSFLKWAGCKYTSLHQILKILPRGRRLVEPFAGSGSVFINTQYSEYLIGEQNGDLIALYTYLQKQGDEFITFCQRYFSAETNHAKKYYELREIFNKTKNLKEKSALFLYLNKHGYNGLCRYNQSGIFNVPFGSYRNPSLPIARMKFFYERSQNAVFQHADFRKLFSQCVEGDIIYCDPPYAPLMQQSNFTSYTQTQFGETEHVALAELAKETAKKRITVIISNHDTPFTRSLYEGSEMISFEVQRNISCNVGNRTPVQEILAVFK